MKLFWIILGGIALVALLAVGVAWICYRMAFYVPRRRPQTPLVPEGETYRPFKEKIEHWAAETEGLPFEAVSITTFDGLRLQGKYFEYKKGAPIELMFHG